MRAGWRKGVVASALTFAVCWSCSPAEAKTPGRTYCFLGVCHYVKTIEETRRMVGRKTTAIASYYDDAKRDRYNPSNITSSGEYFRSWAPDNAASPIYPNGTKLVVWHPQTRNAVMVRINNAGPYYGNRTLDLSRAAAERIGLSSSGVKQVHVVVLAAPTAEEATFRKGRSYAPVRGFMGTFASLDGALASATGAVPAPPLPAKATLTAAVAPGTVKPDAAKSPDRAPGAATPATRLAAAPGTIRRPN
jgi:rare lipoprotein A